MVKLGQELNDHVFPGAGKRAQLHAHFRHASSKVAKSIKHIMSFLHMKHTRQITSKQVYNLWCSHRCESQITCEHTWWCCCAHCRWMFPPFFIILPPCFYSHTEQTLHRSSKPCQWLIILKVPLPKMHSRTQLKPSKCWPRFLGPCCCHASGQHTSSCLVFLYIGLCFSSLE